MGDPIDLSPYFDRRKEEGMVAELALKVFKVLSTLGGHPDFEPQLAGRRWKHGIPDAEPGVAS